MDNKTAIKVMLCEMVVKSEDVKTQDEIETLTSDIADRIVKLFAIPSVVGRSEQLICPCCGSDKTYKTDAIHCNRCAVTTEI